MKMTIDERATGYDICPLERRRWKMITVLLSDNNKHAKLFVVEENDDRVSTTTHQDHQLPTHQPQDDKLNKCILLVPKRKAVAIINDTNIILKPIKWVYLNGSRRS